LATLSYELVDGWHVKAFLLSRLASSIVLRRRSAPHFQRNKKPHCCGACETPKKPGGGKVGKLYGSARRFSHLVREIFPVTRPSSQPLNGMALEFHEQTWRNNLANPRQCGDSRCLSDDDK
jgi:hypothetical protein